MSTEIENIPLFEIMVRRNQLWGKLEKMLAVQKQECKSPRQHWLSLLGKLEPHLQGQCWSEMGRWWERGHRHTRARSGVACWPCWGVWFYSKWKSNPNAWFQAGRRPSRFLLFKISLCICVENKLGEASGEKQFLKQLCEALYSSPRLSVGIRSKAPSGSLKLGTVPNPTHTMLSLYIHAYDKA